MSLTSIPRPPCRFLFQIIYLFAAIALAYSKPINVIQTHGPLTLSHQPYSISHAPVAYAHAPVATYAHAPVATYAHATPVAYATAPVATLHAAPAVATVHAAPALAAAKVEDYDDHPQYSYAYDIKVSSNGIELLFTYNFQRIKALINK